MSGSLRMDYTTLHASWAIATKEDELLVGQDSSEINSKGPLIFRAMNGVPVSAAGILAQVLLRILEVIAREKVCNQHRRDLVIPPGWIHSLINHLS